MVLVHFGFYCQPIPRVRYMMFSLLIGTIGTVLPFFPFFDTKRYRPLRIGLFVTMGFSSIVPLLHLISMKGFLETVWFLKPALYGGLMYCAGVTVYAKRFPEKFFPGRFDSTGMTSHAIWHMFVCLGIFVSSKRVEKRNPTKKKPSISSFIISVPSISTHYVIAMAVCSNTLISFYICKCHHS
jgi:adiponectin receptor